jgi:hypothetical protein
MAVRSPPRGYEPRFDLDLERGRLQENLVRRLVSNDPDHLRLEVKGDYRASSSGAHYVEFRCQGRDGVWRDSGIRTTQADYWAVALPDTGVVLMVPTPKVRVLAEAAIDAGNTKDTSRGDNPTQGAIVPLVKLLG